MALLATTMSVTWAGTDVVASFTDSASVGANTFTTAASFCTGSTDVLTATADTYVDEDNPSTNYGTTATLKLWGDSGHLKRFYVNFTLPTLPAGCSVTSATLTLTRSSSVTNGTLAAYRLASSWTETGLDWSPQPSTAGVAATAASAAVTSFTVTTQVEAMYPSSDFGFVVKASNEDSNTEQVFHSRTGTTPPTLTVVIG